MSDRGTADAGSPSAGGLSQRELGNLIGRPAPQIARWERGEVDPGFALVQRVMRACGFDFDEQLVPWADEFRESLEQNLRMPPAERFARALDAARKLDLPGAAAHSRRARGCTSGVLPDRGLARASGGAERLSIGVERWRGSVEDAENERRLDEAVARLGAKPAARRLLSKLEGFSDVKTPAGLLRIVVRPHGTHGFDRDLRRVSDREHLGAGPYDLAPLTPKIEERHAEESSGWRAEGSGRWSLARRISSAWRGTIGMLDDRLRELRRLAELEALSPR